MNKKQKKPSQLKAIPIFQSEREERRFWLTHDSTGYVDWDRAENVRFPNLRLTSRPITIRLPQSMIDRLKIRARKMDIPYQSLVKQILHQALSASR